VNGASLIKMHSFLVLIEIKTVKNRVANIFSYKMASLPTHHNYKLLDYHEHVTKEWLRFYLQIQQSMINN